MAKPRNKGKPDNTIAVNRKATHDYFIEETFEAGLSLEGWEVKSLRAGRANLSESYVFVKNGEAWILGAHITPLQSASTHINTHPIRTRKLLLHNYELNKLIGAVERRGFALVPLSMYWIRGRAKLKIGVGKGKKQHDKRADLKERDWKREKERLFKDKNY